MQLKIYQNHFALSLSAANEIIEQVTMKPASVLCLAAGDTPKLAYELMAKKAAEEKIDFSKCTFIALDEWLGIPPDNEGSCCYFLQKNIFEPLQIAASQIHLFNALAENTDEECKKMDTIIFDKGGIDLILAGVGMNGHIGFNEPGVALDKYSHVISLDATTQSAGQKYFNRRTDLQKGITLGFHHILRARKLLLMASGIKKAAIMQKAIEEEINNQIPASMVRTHADSLVMIDNEAASLLQRTTNI